MKDLLEMSVKYLKYDDPIKIEKESKSTKGTTIVRVIGEIRKDLNATAVYKKESKESFFDHPIYHLFPSKNITIKKAEYISYVSKGTNEEDILTCLKKIENVISNIYLNDTCKDTSFSEDLLSLFMEICRQVTILNYDIGVLLKQVFNYKLHLLNRYHKLFKSSLTLNIKKQLSQEKILANLKNEIQKKKKIISSLKTETIEVEEIIEKETINTEKELSEMNAIYQNKTEKLKKNNQRKKEEFTRILKS